MVEVILIPTAHIKDIALQLSQFYEVQTEQSDALIDHSGYHDRLEECRQKTTATLPAGLEIPLVVLYLPDADYSRHSASQGLRSKWLLLKRDCAIVVRLVCNDQDEDEIRKAHSCHEPHHRTPFPGSSNDEVCEEGAEVGRENEDCYPDADLTRMLMEIEHIFDACKTNDLICR